MYERCPSPKNAVSGGRRTFVMHRSRVSGSQVAAAGAVRCITRAVAAIHHTGADTRGADGLESSSAPDTRWAPTPGLPNQLRGSRWSQLLRGACPVWPLPGSAYSFFLRLSVTPRNVLSYSTSSL